MTADQVLLGIIAVEGAVIAYATATTKGGTQPPPRPTTQATPTS